MATLCFCPPEICEPFTPTFFSNPDYPVESDSGYYLPFYSASETSFSSPSIKDKAFACLAAFIISSSETLSML
jgi:hypothetical protein